MHASDAIKFIGKRLAVNSLTLKNIVNAIKQYHHNYLYIKYYFSEKSFLVL